MDLFENFTSIILKMSKLIQKIKTIEMKEYDLKAVHVMCIYYLDKCNSLTNKQLVELTFEDKAFISRSIAFLKEKDIVTYDDSKYNYLISLTQKGKDIASFINERSNEAISKSSLDISDEERIELYNNLNKILCNVTNYYKELIEK